MDDFLTKLYEEEQTKVASAEIEAFMRGMDRDDLEAFLGLDKVAVGGPAEAEMPANWQGKELDASQKAKNDYLAQEHQGTPTSVEKTDKWAQTCNSQEGDSKSKAKKEDEPKTKAAEAKLLWADKIGRIFAKQAMVEKEDEFTNPQAKAKAKAFAATMKATKGQSLETRKSALRKTDAAIEKKAQGEPGFTERRPYLSGALQGAAGGALGALAGGQLPIGGMRFSPKAQLVASGLGALGGAGLGAALGPAEARRLKKKREAKASEGKEKGSQGLGGELGGEMGGGMETTAAVKAKIAARAMKVADGAPEHVKAAAVFLAGREMSKVAGEMPQPPKLLDSSTRAGNIEKVKNINESLNKVLTRDYGDKR